MQTSLVLAPRGEWSAEASQGLGDVLDGIGTAVGGIIEFVFDDVVGPVIDGVGSAVAGLGGGLITAFVLYCIFGDEIGAWWRKFRASGSGQDAVAAAKTAAERAAAAVEKAGAAVADAVTDAVAAARTETSGDAVSAAGEGAPAPDPRADAERRLLAAAGSAGIDAGLFSTSEHGRAVVASLIRLSGYARGYQGVRFGGEGSQPVTPRDRGHDPPDAPALRAHPPARRRAAGPRGGGAVRRPAGQGGQDRLAYLPR